jgi:hypothetical protein
VTISTMNKNLYRFGALCGPLYVILVVLGNDVLSSGSPDSTASPAAIGQWWRSHPVTLGMGITWMVELVGLLAFPVFVATLAWSLHRAERAGTWLPAAVLSFGLLSSAIKLGSGAPMLALALRADTIPDDLAAALVDMNGMAFVLTWAADAGMLAAAAAVILTTRCLPRWLGWWAAVAAPLLLVGIPLAMTGPPFFLLALIWFIATGIAMARRGAPNPLHTAHPHTPTPAAAH